MRPYRPTSLFVGLACLAILLAAVDTAHAGSYVMRSCNVPGAARTTVGPWTWSLGPGAFANDDCAIGGGFGINAGVMPSTLAPSIGMETGPGITISRVRLWLVARLRGTGSPMFVSVVSGSPAGASAIDLFAPPGGDTLSTPYASPPLSPNTTAYRVVVNCSGSTGEPCTPTDTNILDIRGAEVTLEESTVPVATINAGDLMSGGPQSGVRTLGFNVADHESGVTRITVLIGDTVVGVVDYLGECAFGGLAACQQVRAGSVPADTRKVSNGFYPVSLRALDAAGNTTTVQSPVAVQVANAVGSAAAPVTSPQSTGSIASTARLSVSFASNRRSSRTVAYGRSSSIRGRLLQEDNSPIGGAQIDVQEVPVRGGAMGPHRFVTTGVDGRFTYIAERGPSRTLTFAYGTSATGKLKLRVAASATLDVSLDGVRVRYRGRVLTSPIPRRGKVVQIQGRAPGAGWTTFATRRSDRRGVFSGTYRLRVHRPGVRLKFRVRIPNEGGYPFVAHSGSPVSRTVR